MARKKKADPVVETSGAAEDFTADLIKSLNKERGTRVAYNLSTDESPTHVNRWISTGSQLLDYIISNQREGGLPEGRIVEILDHRLLVSLILLHRLQSLHSKWAELLYTLTQRTLQV